MLLQHLQLTQLCTTALHYNVLSDQGGAIRLAMFLGDTCELIGSTTKVTKSQRQGLIDGISESCNDSGIPELESVIGYFKDKCGISSSEESEIRDMFSGLQMEDTSSQIPVRKLYGQERDVFPHMRLLYPYGALTSCKKLENTHERSPRYLKTDGLTDCQTRAITMDPNG